VIEIKPPILFHGPEGWEIMLWICVYFPWASSGGNPPDADYCFAEDKRLEDPVIGATTSRR